MDTFQPAWWLIASYLFLMLAIGIWAARTKVSKVEDMDLEKKFS